MMNMTNHGAELSTSTIVKTVFDFIKDNFDRFEHRKRNGEKNWWHNHKYGQEQEIDEKFILKRGDSWAPFVEACFIKEGNNRGYLIGHSFTHPNITFVFRDFFGEVYNETNKYKDYKKIDVSWRENKSELILALEHSEDSKGHSKLHTTADGQLDQIKDEIDNKLKNEHSDYKVIVSRPYLRGIPRGDNYPELTEYFKIKIKDMLRNVNPKSDEKWIIILIAPVKDIQQTGDSTHIKFHCYEWMQNDLQLIEGSENCSFEVEMNDGEYVKCK